MISKKKKDYRELKIKRLVMFLLGMVFFSFPGQSYYQVVQADFQKIKTQKVNLEIPLPSLYPENISGIKVPPISAYSVIIIDRHSGTMIYGKNEKTQLLPASTSKVMTALVALDHYPLDQVLTVGEVTVLGQKMKLLTGELITTKNLLYGLLVYSANDAAETLAENYPGGRSAFIKKMNQKAQVLNLEDTYFANPTGLDSDNNGQLLVDFSYTTALDLARLVNYALQNQVFDDLISTQKIMVTDVTGNIKHILFNLNELLGKVEGLKGAKTGWTEDAGACLVSYTERKNNGIIIVVLGSEDRFGDTEKLINWVFANFQWKNVTPTILDQ